MGTKLIFILHLQTYSITSYEKLTCILFFVSGLFLASCSTEKAHEIRLEPVPV